MLTLYTLLGDLNGDPLWKLVRGFISTPSEQQKQCHAPKPILLNTGAVRGVVYNAHRT